MELVLVTLISLIVIVAVLASRLNDNSFPFPFDSRSTIFTPAEKNFHKPIFFQLITFATSIYKVHSAN